MTVLVKALTCPRCQDTIFSRTGHDYHSCSCGGVSVDGGFDYLRVAWQSELVGPLPPEAFGLRLTLTREELYRDWSTKADKWGRLPPGMLLVKEPLPEEK